MSQIRKEIALAIYDQDGTTPDRHMHDDEMFHLTGYTKYNLWQAGMAMYEDGLLDSISPWVLTVKGIDWAKELELGGGHPKGTPEAGKGGKDTFEHAPMPDVTPGTDDC